jgi:S1-C subfamily serine protease
VDGAPLRLRSIDGLRRGQEFVFSGPRVRIGRSRDNDLILPDRENPHSSSHHAEAVLDSSGRWSIVDVGSANGTTVNGALISRQVLHSGDTVALGDERFVVLFGRRSYTSWIFGGAAIALAISFTVAFELMAHRQAPFQAVAARAAQSVFLIAVDEGGKRSAIGTAFAVTTTGLLATNAHIAAELDRQGAIGDNADAPVRAIAIQGDSYAARRIVRAAVAPGWQSGSIKDDVALLQVEAGAPLVPLRVANGDVQDQIVRGTPVATFGFPAVSTDVSHPRGRLSVDVVGDVRGEYLEVGLGIAPGTSGSPLFDQNGNVVGIVAGGDFAPPGPNELPRPTGSSANWALSARVLRSILP